MTESNKKRSPNGDQDDSRTDKQEALSSFEEGEVAANEMEKIKSTAVVKYSAPKPAQFMKLKCNTDLNMPPTNWLSNQADPYGLQYGLWQRESFSSFRMAHAFPDCVGEVDVISDAENIKNLLKIPYYKGHISMVVHRVENTLLLDNFDIYKHLLRNSEKHWRWLREFFMKIVNHETCEENRYLYAKSRRRKALMQKNLVSKFLYHSLVLDNKDSADLALDNSKSPKVETKNSIPMHLQEPLLPEPALVTPGPVKINDKCSANICKDPLHIRIESPLPEPSSTSESNNSTKFDHNYNRNVVWTFEDIEMLIGTDLPIFGGGTHPCISLRLRDVSKPINVLTGIDYWLDNLMCNVPEVVMCYHLNGIVQKYELVKTEDLPRLNNSKFSPKLIRDVAQSILSFLKSNATKAGHTYWLFKGKDEEVIKLYDLTSLCPEKDVKESQNPFTIPVAMLLYRVARNMKPSSSRQAATVRMLLRHCIKLLPEQAYPEIVTSSHYMSSNLYIPTGTNPESPGLEQSDGEDSDSFFDDDEDDSEAAAKFLILDQNNLQEKFNNIQKRPPPITGTVEERCLQAVSHVVAGLNCLKYFPHENAKAEESKDQDTEVPMAKPFVPIPMPYSKLDQPELSDSHHKKTNKKHKDRNKRKNEKCPEKLDDNKTSALLLKNQQQAQRLPTWQDVNGMPNISWKEHLKTLLYDKAVLVYATLSEFHFRAASYGNSLRTIGLLARCQLVLSHLTYTSNSLQENCLLGRAGDCAIMMVQNWTKIDSYREQYQNNTDEDLKIMEQLKEDERFYGISIGKSNTKCVFLHTLRTQEQMIFKAVECYEESLKCSEDEVCLRRLGNGLNEIGTLYLNKAKAASVSKATIEMCKKAESFLQRGINIFEKINDTANTALLYTNMGHMQRLLLHANTDLDKDGLAPLTKLHFNKAVLSYKKALQVLGDRQHYPPIWDTVTWELSTTLFNMSTVMVENCPSKSKRPEVEKLTIEVLQKALQHCDLDEENPKFPLYQYRAATIHLRIGSLYHTNILSSGSEAVHKKNIIQLAKINYDKAAKYYLAAADVMPYLSTKLKRVALSEFLYENSTTPNIKIKHLQHCISLLVSMNDVLKLVVEKKVDKPETDANTEVPDQWDYRTFSSLLNLTKTRLQTNLKLLIKLCLMKPSPNKDCPQLANIYKACYISSFELEDGLGEDELASRLHNILKKIRDQVATIEIID